MASVPVGGEGLAMTTGSGRGGGLVVVRRLVLSWLSAAAAAEGSCGSIPKEGSSIGGSAVR